MFPCKRKQGGVLARCARVAANADGAEQINFVVGPFGVPALVRYNRYGMGHERYAMELLPVTRSSKRIKSMGSILVPFWGVSSGPFGKKDNVTKENGRAADGSHV